MQQRAGLEPLGVEVELLGDAGHQPLLVGGVVDREAGPEAELVDLLAQDPHAGGVERRDPHDPGPLADQLLDPLLHLGGGLVGEGDRQDRARVGLALGDQPRDPPGQHPGLARPGAGDDQQRRALVDDRGALRLVEPLEQLLAGRAAAPLLGRRGEVLEPGQGFGRHVLPSLCGGTDGRSGPGVTAGRGGCGRGRRPAASAYASGLRPAAGDQAEPLGLLSDQIRSAASSSERSARSSPVARRSATSSRMLAARRSEIASCWAAHAGSVAPASRSAAMIGTVRGSTRRHRRGVGAELGLGGRRLPHGPDVVALLGRHRCRPLGQLHVVDGEQQLRLAARRWRRRCRARRRPGRATAWTDVRGVPALGEQLPGRSEDRQPGALGGRPRREAVVAARSLDRLRHGSYVIHPKHFRTNIGARHVGRPADRS